MIITNHALLLTDEANQRIHTGDADTFVIDEAHHFERAAGEQYGARADYVFLHKRLMRLGTLKQRGILKKAERLYRSAGISPESFSKWTNGSLSFLKKAICSLRLFILLSSGGNQETISTVSYIRSAKSVKAGHGTGLKKAREDCVPCCMTCTGCFRIKRKASLKNRLPSPAARRFVRGIRFMHGRP